MKTALIIGGNGFIGGNLATRLKKEKWEVTVIDIKQYPYGKNSADAVSIGDIRNFSSDIIDFNHFDRIYQLAADMGGAGFVFTGDNDADIFNNSLGVNLYVARELQKANYKGILFYSSSVCVYPDNVEGKESDAYPADPPSNYGWEKLSSERIYQAYAKNYGLDVKIARFHNCFGPYGTYEGGREKSPAAICRKVALAANGDEIEIWGDGKQLRPFIFIEDLLDGIEALVSSNLQGPVNLGPSGGITIDGMVDLVAGIAGKTVTKKHIPGPTGGQNRYANNDMAREKLDWFPKRYLIESFRTTYEWIKNELDA